MTHYVRSSSQSSTFDAASYTTTANQVTGYLFSEVEEFHNKLLTEQQEHVGPWRYAGVKKGVSIYKSPSQFQSKTPRLLGRIKIKCQPGYLASYLTNPQTRYYYDNSLKETKLLQRINDNVKVYYTAFQTKKCLVNYNVSICNIAAHRREGDTYISGYCSVPQHKNMVVETGVPTIWVHYSGFVVKPGVTEGGVSCSDVFYIFQFDYKGDLPTFVVNFAMERQMSQLASIKLLIEGCLLSPAFSDAGDSLTRAGLSRQNSEESRSSGSNRNMLRIPSGSTASLGSIGCGLERCDSFSSAKSAIISCSNGSSSPPLSMKSFSEPVLNQGDDPLTVFYADSSEDERALSRRESNESLMQSIMVQREALPQSLIGKQAFTRQDSILSEVSDHSTLIEHQYEKVAKRVSSELHKEYIEIVESVRYASVQHSSLAWKVIDQKSGVWILENTDSEMLHVCGVTRVNADCDTLVEYLTNLNNMIEYDKFLLKAMMVEEIKDNLQILYMQFKTKRCLMVQYERDACVFRHLSRKENKAMIVYASASHPNCDPDKNITRLAVKLSGFIVEALPNDTEQCSLVFVSKVDMGPGYFPHSLLWLIKRRQPLLLARIANHFKK